MLQARLIHFLLPLTVKEVLLIMPGQYCKVGLQDKQGYLVTLFTALIVCDWGLQFLHPTIMCTFRAGCMCHAAMIMKSAKGYDLLRETPPYHFGGEKTR